MTTRFVLNYMFTLYDKQLFYFYDKSRKLRSTTVACIMLMKNYGSSKLIEKGNILFIGIYFNGMLSVVLRKFDFSCTCLRNIINLRLRLPPLLISKFYNVIISETKLGILITNGSFMVVSIQLENSC